MSKELELSNKYFPGGVNSPVRAFKSVGCEPPFIKSAYGSRVIDVHDNEYIDYVGTWGPAILGHAEESVIEAVRRTALDGLSFGAPTIAETELAQLICEAFPVIEKMRFVSSGTEATMSAIRLARGFTNRPYIIKCDGGYHGHGDSLLVSAGSGVATLGIPGCPGIPEGIASNTLVVPFNNLEAVEKVFEAHKDKVAAMIVEPVCGNMGVVNPKDGYLQGLRKLCDENRALLIFDEVMTGFRGCYGGVSKVVDVKPDLTTLGKVVGGGMPLAVYGGRADIMSMIAPDGPVYQAGTLSGNPIAVAAGIATLKKLKSDHTFYLKLISSSEKLEKGLLDIAKEAGVKLQCNRYGAMMTIFFNDSPVTDYETAKKSNTDLFAKWFRGMLDRKIYLPPSQFEALFISGAHTDADIERTLYLAKEVLNSVH